MTPWAFPEPRDPQESTGAASRGMKRAFARRIIRAIASAYDDPITRSYARIRFTILRQPFLEEIGQYLPTSGTLLDLGCGFGLFSMYYAATEPRRNVVGIDLSARRISRASRTAAALDIRNVSYAAADVLSWETELRFDSIYFLDLVHHLPAAGVRPFIAKVASLIAPHGTLVIKDVADRPVYKRMFTLALDRLMVGLEPIQYWSQDELCGLLEDLGFQVVTHRMTDILPYPHVLYIARRSESHAMSASACQVPEMSSTAPRGTG